MDYSTVETTARVREWQYLTGRDFEKIDHAHTAVMVSVSPLEVHGPHLPVVTDNMESEGLMLRTIERLCERHPELQVLHLPPIYVAADVLPHPGSVMFRSSTIMRVLEDVGRTLGRQGFRHIWLGNFHGGPRHFVPMEVAAARSNRLYGTEMVSVFSLLIKQLTGGGSDLKHVLGHIDGLSAEELDGDAHGGAIETSMMLHLLGRHVDPAFAELDRRTVSIKLAEQGLPPIEQGRLSALLRSFKHKLKYFETETYAGKPSLASAEIGRQVIEELSRHTADALSDVYTGKLSASDCHSPLWKVRWIFTTEVVGRAFERVLDYKSRVF